MAFCRSFLPYLTDFGFPNRIGQAIKIGKICAID